jgi:hypothetical protein
VQVGDLVIWSQGHCTQPGLVLEIRPAKRLQTSDTSLSPTGLAVLAMLPELPNLEWFHERELEIINENR